MAPGLAMQVQLTRMMECKYVRLRVTSPAVQWLVGFLEVVRKTGKNSEEVMISLEMAAEDDEDFIREVWICLEIVGFGNLLKTFEIMFEDGHGYPMHVACYHHAREGDD